MPNSLYGSFIGRQRALCALIDGRKARRLPVQLFYDGRRSIGIPEVMPSAKGLINLHHSDKICFKNNFLLFSGSIGVNDVIK